MMDPGHLVSIIWWFGFIFGDMNQVFPFHIRYWQLDMDMVGGPEAWDRAVYDASEVYKGRVVRQVYPINPSSLT